MPSFLGHNSYKLEPWHGLEDKKKKNNAFGRVRTHDLSLNRRMLYHWATKAACMAFPSNMYWSCMTDTRQQKENVVDTVCCLFGSVRTLLVASVGYEIATDICCFENQSLYLGHMFSEKKNFSTGRACVLWHLLRLQEWTVGVRGHTTEMYPFVANFLVKDKFKLNIWPLHCTCEIPQKTQSNGGRSDCACDAAEYWK